MPSIELVRWPSNILPTIERDGETFRVTQPNPKGHIFKLVPIDGATIVPTHDPEFPVMQRLQGDIGNAVYFGQNEIGRVVLTPRPEIRIRGYGMPPPQRIYIAISLLYYGNQYYARLLLDTPEAGILDLLDMSQQDAIYCKALILKKSAFFTSIPRPPSGYHLVGRLRR
jgi:hypothetical protein